MKLLAIVHLIFSINLVVAADAPLMDTESGFKRFFEAVLHKFTDDFQVYVDEATVQISSEGQLEQIKAELSRILQSNSNFFNHLGYRVQNATIWQDPDAEGRDIARHKPNNLDEAINYTKSVFGSNMFDILGLTSESIFKVTQGAKFENGVLYTSEFPKDTVKVLKSYAKFWVSSIANKSVWDIRRSIYGDGSFKPSLRAMDHKKAYHVSGLFQRSCVVLESENKVQIIFDLNYIHNLIMPPTIVKERKQEKEILVIDRSHIMTYLKQLSSDGILLSIFESDGTTYAHPMIVAEKARDPKPAYHYFVIDHSQSIASNYPIISSILNEFIDKISDTNPLSKACVIFFSNSIDKKSIFPLCNKTDIKCIIKDPKIDFGNQTSLNDAVDQVFKEIKNDELAKRYHVTLTVITDGKDNKSIIKVDQLGQSIQATPESLRPTIFTFGFGDADQEKLNQLSASCSSPYIKCNSVEDLKILHDHLEAFTHEREIYEFLVKLVDNKEMSISIPVLKNNSPHLVKILLPLTDNELYLKVQGKELTVRLEQHQAVRKATTADQIYLLRSEAVAIDSNQNLLPGKKGLEYKAHC